MYKAALERLYCLWLYTAMTMLLPMTPKMHTDIKKGTSNRCAPVWNRYGSVTGTAVDTSSRGVDEEERTVENTVSIGLNVGATVSLGRAITGTSRLDSLSANGN